MEFDFKKIAIVYNPEIEGAEEIAKIVAQKTQNPNIFKVKDFALLSFDPVSFEYVASIGGDGTLLRSADICAPFDIKIFGFNLGRLGYLAQANPENIDWVLEKLKNGEFRVEDRIMLKANLEDKKLIALNDIVIKGATFSRTSTLKLYINDILVSKYLADGLIISTPTGSTAYTLSAGGPVLAPNLDAFTIVPICPHTLSARPLVIPSCEKIKVEFSECNKFFVTSDGQNSVEIKGQIEIQKYEKNAKLILLNKEKDEFYNVLREKLHWGQKIDK